MVSAPKRRLADSHLEVEVGPVAAAGAAELPDHLAGVDLLAELHRRRLQHVHVDEAVVVGGAVDRRGSCPRPPAVGIAVLAAIDDDAVVHRDLGRPGLAEDVLALVDVAVARRRRSGRLCRRSRAARSSGKTYPAARPCGVPWSTPKSAALLASDRRPAPASRPGTGRPEHRAERRAQAEHDRDREAGLRRRPGQTAFAWSPHAGGSPPPAPACGPGPGRRAPHARSSAGAAARPGGFGRRLAAPPARARSALLAAAALGRSRSASQPLQALNASRSSRALDPLPVARRSRGRSARGARSLAIRPRVEGAGTCRRPASRVRSRIDDADRPLRTPFRAGLSDFRGARGPRVRLSLRLSRRIWIRDSDGHEDREERDQAEGEEGDHLVVRAAVDADPVGRHGGGRGHEQRGQRDQAEAAGDEANLPRIASRAI